MDQDGLTREQQQKQAREWLEMCGWETNNLQGRHERWRCRCFDPRNKWVTFRDAIKLQTEWDEFWAQQ